MIVQIVHEGEVLRSYGDLIFGADVPATGDAIKTGGGWRRVTGRLWGGLDDRAVVRVVVGEILDDQPESAFVIVPSTEELPSSG